ncbi:ATP-dependent Clp protease proteolytic subunit [Myxococcota bacterium]|nr:ATP-dependent Clp protease proteolytic subunit [Myxococcota bacterium]
MDEWQEANRNEDREAEEGPRRDEALVSRMLETRTILLAGQVDEKLAEKVMAQLLVLNGISHDPIRLVITTPGGHVDSGYAIHDLIRFIESPVITVGAGWVASIGVPILLAAEKDQRYSLPNTRFLLHQPSGGAGGQAADIRIAAEEILKLRSRLNHLIAKETGQSVEKVEQDSDRNFWMDAEQALEYGLVSRLIRSAEEID